MTRLEPSGGSGAPVRTLAVVAIAIPTLIAFNMPPSSTLLNQAASFVGWGSFLVALTANSRGSRAGFSPLHTALLLCVLASAGSSWIDGLPWALGRSNIGMILAAIVASAAAYQAQRGGEGTLAVRALFMGLVVATVASTVVALVQVYAPQWCDGEWIAKSAIPGRATGNMRQPNHLSSLLLWGLIAAVALGDSGVLRKWLTWPFSLAAVLGVVLSGSRTGALGMGVLTAWALLDRRLSRSTRWLLGLMPLFYLVFWLGNSAWADYSHHVFGGETRFSTAGDISSSRYGIWSNTLELIKAHPWFGVGFGEFNFAWTLTPFPGRPVAFFDHTHNLPLQLIVEMGIPLGLLVLGLLLFALYRALRNVMPQPDRDPALPPQAPTAAFMIVLMIGLHSLLEYPLWYAYFLLPTAFAFGLCLGDPPKGRPVPAPQPADNRRTRPLLLASMLMFGAGFYVLYDYDKVVRIFVADDSAAPLAQRIVEGRHSVFFAHHADYAAATVAIHPSTVMSAFKRAPHYLLDARLMMAWAKALNEAGETDKARYVAQRLKEFRNEQAAEFFAPCDQPIPQADKPFQCQQPSKALSYEDFR